MRSFVADGNFKADHLKQKNDDTEAWLTSGEGFMTENDRYNDHLNSAKDSAQVSSVPPVGMSGRHNSFIQRRSRHATVIELNLMETLPTILPIVLALAVMHAPDMAASCLALSSISKKENDR